MQGNKKMREYFSSLDPNKASQKEIENFMRSLLQDYALEVAGVKFAFAPRSRLIRTRIKIPTNERQAPVTYFFIISALISVLIAQKRLTAGCSCARFGRLKVPSR